MTTLGLPVQESNIDTRQAKLMRAATGALYGFMGGVTFVFIAAFIDIWLHRDLPLGIDWALLWGRLPLFGLGLALVGATTCWFHDAGPGLLSGAITASALALVVALFSENTVGAGMKFVVLIFILIPIAAMMVPISWLLRWFVERHARALRSEGGMRRVAGLIVLALVLGAVAGYFTKMSAREVEATRNIHALLQSPLDATNPVGKAQGIAEHQGSPYRLYSTASETSVEGVDVRAVFEDGYSVTCTAILYPGQPPFISGCISE